MPIISKIFLRIVCLTIVLLSAGSCRDEIDIPGGEIPEGWARVTLNVDFTQFMPTRLGSRSAGDSFDKMQSLWIVVYDENGENLLKTKRVALAEPCTEKEDVMELPFGRYQIYAVANIDELPTTYANEIKTAAGLRNLSLEWKTNPDGGLGQNDQMMGYFAVQEVSGAAFPFPDSPTVTIDKRDVTITANVVRAASKVTVAYDGSDLKDGVKIYIKSVQIKNIPRNCLLGAPNTITNTENLIEDGEKIDYAGGSAFDDNHPGLLTNKNPYFPRRNATGGYDDTNKDPHSHTSDGSLFFYENLQGTGPDKQQKDENHDGVLDNLFPFKDIPCATYIEVEAYYESTNPERPGVSDIIYRFALGNNITDNYDATRNHHYKLTLHFNGYAIEPDWRIDYVKFFGVSQPHAVNYQGKFFVPDYSKVEFNGALLDNNGGNEFSDNNIITVNSYMFNKEDESKDWVEHLPVGYTIEYSDSIGEGQFSEYSSTKPDWFDFADIATDAEKGVGIHKLKLSYACKFGGEVDLDSILKKTTSITKDLSIVNGKVNTANCYIVSSKGTYTFPLVYGNAIQNGSDNTSSYKGFSDADTALTHFQNYLGKPIQSPYILEDAKYYNNNVAISANNLSTQVVWEDVQNLVQNVKVTTNGNISFTVGDNIKQGNAVIAIKNGSTIMWSWHIWVTSFDYDRSVTLTNYYDEKKTIMPVNLGWCSGDNTETANNRVRYYDRHVCYMKFTQGRRENEDPNSELYEQIVKIVQEPHIITPLGYNPYYQWGRKDPFPGSTGGNISVLWWYENDSKQIVECPWRWTWTDTYRGGYETYNSIFNEDKNTRPYTKDILGNLIQNPGKFNNPRFQGWVPEIKDENGKVIQDGVKGYNDDINYSNLWNNDDKTVYDPCPYGYMVAPSTTFTGFTSVGWGSWSDGNFMWFNVDKSNMLTGYTYYQGIFEFYTNRGKLESVIFPMTGYLDYDDILVYNYFDFSKKNGHGYYWEATHRNIRTSEYLKFIVEGGVPQLVNPNDAFYATDGCSVRPLKMETSSTPTTPESRRRR